MSAAVLALVPVVAAAAGAGGFAAARMRQASPSGRHPGFTAGYPRSGEGEARSHPGPRRERPAPARRRPRRGWRVTVTVVAAAAAWTALTAYAHVTGYGPLVVALIAAAVTWSRIRPGRARRRARGW